MDAADRTFALLDEVDTVLTWVSKKGDLPSTDLQMLTQVRDQLDDYVTKIMHADEELTQLPESTRITTLRSASRAVVAKILDLRFGGRVPPVQR